jgi:nicotinamidase/pyrazinamidase
VQADFMLPGGKLYVPGAEKILPNIRKLTDAARRGEVYLVSHGCFHTANDPEFKQFPPHCVKGTPGAEFVPEALTGNFVRVENDARAKLPENLFQYQQIILEKQTLDIFQSRHADELLERKRRVAVVRDAIETLAPEAGDKMLTELQTLGATLVRTEEILAKLHARA